MNKTDRNIEKITRKDHPSDDNKSDTGSPAIESSQSVELSEEIKDSLNTEQSPRDIALDIQREESIKQKCESVDRLFDFLQDNFISLETGGQPTINAAINLLRGYKSLREEVDKGSHLMRENPDRSPDEFNRLVYFLLEHCKEDIVDFEFKEETPIDAAIRILGSYNELKEEAKQKTTLLKENLIKLRDDFVRRTDLASMAVVLMESMLQKHVFEFAKQLYEIDYKMPPHHFLMALIVLANEQGNFPMALSIRDSDWDSPNLGEKKFVSGCGCGEHPQARIGQKYFSNECAARHAKELKKKAEEDKVQA